MAISDDTPLSFLTVGDLKEIIAQAVDTGTGRLNGVAGIMETFHCSQRQAVRIKASGIIDAAIYQDGKKCQFSIDPKLARQLYDRAVRIKEE